MKDVSYAELFGGVGQTKSRHFAKLCKIKVKHIDMEEESQDFTQSDYTTPFFVTNDQVKIPSRLAKVHYMYHKDTLDTLDPYG